MATDAVLFEGLQTMQTRIDLIFEQQKRDHEFLQAQLDTLKSTIAKTAVAATTTFSKEKSGTEGADEVASREVVSLGDVSSKIGRLPEDSVRAYLEELKRLRSEYDDLVRYATSNLHHLQTPTTTTSPTPTATVLAPLQEGIKDYWAKAEVDVSSGMFVDVGLGLHLEMSFEEARDWAAQVVGALEVRIEQVREVVDGSL